MNVGVAAILLAALLAASGCRTPLRAVPLPSDDPRPPLLLQAVSESARARRALRGLARLAVDSDRRDVRVRGKLAVVLARPARLRVEVLGLLGQTVAVLVTDGQRFQWFSPQDRSYRTGAVYPDLLWDVVNVPLTAPQVVDLVLGRAQVGLRVRGAADAGDGTIRVDLAEPGGKLRERVAFDTEARLRAVEVLPGRGAVARRERFDRYEVQDGIAFAREISVVFPELDVKADLSLSDVELNPALAPDVFRLEIPGVGALPDGGGG